MKKRYSGAANMALHTVCILLSLMCILPLVLVVSVSLTSETGILNHGYTLFPSEFSLDAYKYIWNVKDTILRAYGVTIFNTAAGSVISVLVIALYAYALSRPNLLGKTFFTFYIFFTMLFSGGLVAWYMVCTQVLHIQNTIWAQILPYSMNAWNVIIMRTFYTSTVPESMLESARIDGSGELRIFFELVLPIAVPGIATIAMFQVLTYWNDWWLGINLITDPKLYNLQILLQNMLSNIEQLKNSAETVDASAAAAVANPPAEGTRMALCMVALGPILAVYPFFQKYFIQGLTVGAVKG